MSGTRSIPWWLAGGTERCRFCFGSYPWEDERRCATCDEGLCALCAHQEEAHGPVICPGCADTEL